ncbi:MAG: helix-turn-helix domain-containing protein [Putridiphycobacter sp.]
MKSLKTYNQIYKANTKSSFGISKTEDIYDKRKGEPDVPHRHNFFTILFTKKAKGTHFIDFNAYDLKPNQVFFIAPGQVHQVIEHSKTYGFVLVFSHQFLIENNIPIAFIEDLNLFNHSGDTPPLVLNETLFTNVFKYLENAFEIYGSDLTYKNQALGALLKLILIQCNNSCTLPPDLFVKNNSQLRTFKSLIHEHYKTLHATSDYAKKLNISPDHLNKVVKSKTGKTAKEHIQQRLVIEAKRLLYFTDLSHKEIAFELGFSEPAHFSSFFKKNVGISPSDFQQNK